MSTCKLPASGPKIRSETQCQRSAYSWRCWRRCKSQLSLTPGWLCWPHWLYGCSEGEESLVMLMMDADHQQEYASEGYPLRIKRS